jgi:hypothetical protein
MNKKIYKKIYEHPAYGYINQTCSSRWVYKKYYYLLFKYKNKIESGLQISAYKIVKNIMNKIGKCLK